MPIMDGYEATKEIRKLEIEYFPARDVKSYIIGLTAHSTEAYRESCYTSGMDEFSKCYL